MEFFFKTDLINVKMVGQVWLVIFKTVQKIVIITDTVIMELVYVLVINGRVPVAMRGGAIMNVLTMENVHRKEYVTVR